MLSTFSSKRRVRRRFKCLVIMFEGDVSKRGQPPEQLLIGGYDKPNDEEIGQIPVHQSLEAPRQLLLPSVGNLNKMLLCNQKWIRETI